MGIRSDISRIQPCEAAIWTRRGLIMVASWRVAMPIGLKPSASIGPNRDRHSAHPLTVMPDSASGRGARCERAPGLLPRRQWIWHVLADVTGLKGGSRRRNPLGLGAVEEVAWSRLAALSERAAESLSRRSLSTKCLRRRAHQRIGDSCLAEGGSTHVCGDLVPADSLH